MKKKVHVFIFILIFSLIIAIGPTFSTAVYAVDRQVTMSCSASQVSVGNTFTVTLGFTPSALTRNFSFMIGYDDTCIQLIEPCVNLSAIGSGISVGPYNQTYKRRSIGNETDGKTEKMVQLAVRITFKTLKQGSATIQVLNASDGNENRITNVPPHSSPLSRTVTITQQITTTTTTTTTTKPTTTTTKPTTTTTKPTPTTPKSTRSTTITTTTPKSTSTTSTVPSTTPLVTPSMTPMTTEPADVPDPVAWTGKRYDGELLSVPESIPDADRIPPSFSAVEVEHQGAKMDAFQSESLPYTLFWLKAEDDDDGRFYAYDDESGVFVPYFRSEWSARFFTVTVLPEQSVPEGFELTTFKVRGERVPVYRLLPGAFVPYEKYCSGYEDLDVPSPTVEEDQSFDTSGAIDPSENFVEGNDSEARRQKDADRYVYAAEGTDPEPSETESDLQDIPIPDPPKDMVLLVCRVNDSDKKTLFLYDTVYDSMISVGSWPIPVRGSYLEGIAPPAPIVTEKPAEETDAMTATAPALPAETAATEEPRRVSLFGMLLPPWVLIVAVVVLLLLILAVIFAIKSIRARRRHSFTYEEDDFYETRDDNEDKGVLYIKGMKREYTRMKPDPVSEDNDFSSSPADESEYEKDALADYPDEDELVSGPIITAGFDRYSVDENDVVDEEPISTTDFDNYSDDREEVMAESSLIEEIDIDSDDEDDEYFITDPVDHFAEQSVDVLVEESFGDQRVYGEDDALMAESSVADDYSDFSEELDDEYAQDPYDGIKDDVHVVIDHDEQDLYDNGDIPLSVQSASDNHFVDFSDRGVDDVIEELFDDQDMYDEGDESSEDYFDPAVPSELSGDHYESEVAFSSHAFDRTDDVSQDVSSSEEVSHVRRRPSPDAMRRFPNMRQVFLQSSHIRQPEPESDDREPYSRRSREDLPYFEEAYQDDDEI